MESFISTVLKDILQKHKNTNNLVFILPSERAGNYLKKELSKQVSKTIFTPEILSIEKFIKKISGLEVSSNSEILLELYNIYQKHTPKPEQQNFDEFALWATMLIQDFNEIDRFLIPPSDIFNYLSAINEMSHWSKSEEPTKIISNYISFWSKIELFYTELKEQLLDSNKAYQGLIYRKASETISHFNTNNLKHIFIGFNALNNCEIKIINTLLNNKEAEVYWDIDHRFIEDKFHSASLFIRNHIKTWDYFKNNEIKGVSKNYAIDKKINIIAAPKQISQVKYVTNLLTEIKEEKGHLKNTALVLGDENLIQPIVKSLPNVIEIANISMGYSVRHTPIFNLVENLFNIHSSNASNVFYYKDVVTILNDTIIHKLLTVSEENFAEKLISQIQRENESHISIDTLTNISKNVSSVLESLFSNKNKDPKSFIDNIFEIITRLKEISNNDLELEHLYKCYKVFLSLKENIINYPFINSLDALHFLYEDIISKEKFDYVSDPFSELQILGMLETRVLDFDTVIITSVNEGILPTGKSQNSFIPFELKTQYGIPTFREKDAIYTYHFYRLLQRAKNIYLVYNTEIDALSGGEKSRFINQLEIEGIHNINYINASPETNNSFTSKLNLEVKKTPEILNRLKEIATTSGFSPSSLTNFIRNPIDFYTSKILKIKEFNDIEENIDYNTLGTVVHNTLEELYKPYEGKLLDLVTLNAFKENVNTLVVNQFKDIYKNGNISTGKNLIIFEIAKQYVVNQIELDIKTIKNGATLEIILIEKKTNTLINIDNIPFPVKLNGTVDRVDRLNNKIRIIDYKSGKVSQTDLNITEWDGIIEDYKKHSKAFQILMYAYILYKEQNISLPVEAGIISFKNFKSGYLKFTKKDTKSTIVNEDILEAFEIKLKELLTSIFNYNTTFKEKDI